MSEYWNLAIMSSELGLWVGNPAMTSTVLMALNSSHGDLVLTIAAVKHVESYELSRECACF